MNLEGTKHEKAVIIIVAYIIGFTSCFIAFGITGVMKPVTVPDMMMPVAVTPEGYEGPKENPPENMEDAVVASAASTASYEDGKLYATVKGERYVLSLHTDVMKTENVEGFATQGIHANLPTYSTSPDGRFVHFCEQQTDEDACSHFLFDADRNVIQPMSVDGERLITSAAVAVSSAWNGDMLAIGTYTSASSEAPWKMVVAQ